jgi:hypothetical protein
MLNRHCPPPANRGRFSPIRAVESGYQGASRGEKRASIHRFQTSDVANTIIVISSINDADMATRVSLSLGETLPCRPLMPCDNRHRHGQVVQPETCLTLQTGYMTDSFLGLFGRCQLPFGGVTSTRACPGSPQEGPARSAATAPSPAERSAGGPCGPTWARPTHLSSDGSSCAGPSAGPGVCG